MTGSEAKSIESIQDGGNDSANQNTTAALIADPQALERLLSEHRILKEAIEHSPIPYCVYDKNDRLIALNNAYADLYANNLETAQLLVDGPGTSYADLMHAQLRHEVPSDELDAAVRERVDAQRYAVGKPVERNYGERGVFNVVKYKLPSGAIGGMVVDISTLKQRERELAQARSLARANERTKSNLIASMGQEVRDLVAQIVSCSQVQSDISDVTVAALDDVALTHVP